MPLESFSTEVFLMHKIMIDPRKNLEQLRDMKESKLMKQEGQQLLIRREST